MALELLKEEHRVIEKVLYSLAAMGAEAEINGEFNIDQAKQAVIFIKGFADKHHHGKEEDFLFTLMQKYNFSMESGPLAVMMYEHDAGRALIGDISASLEKISANQNVKEETLSFSTNVKTFCELLAGHIQKEDRILYPMAEQAIEADDMKELNRLVNEYEEKANAMGVQANFNKIADDLIKSYESKLSELGIMDFGCAGGCCH